MAIFIEHENRHIEAAKFPETLPAQTTWTHWRLAIRRQGEGDKPGRAIAIGSACGKDCSVKSDAFGTNTEREGGIFNVGTVKVVTGRAQECSADAEVRVATVSAGPCGGTTRTQRLQGSWRYCGILGVEEGVRCRHVEDWRRRRLCRKSRRQHDGNEWEAKRS